VKIKKEVRIFMSEIIGLTGLRPTKEYISKVTCPPYDVIKPGTQLEAFFKSKNDSLFHVILGENPSTALENLITKGILQKDDEPCFYVYEQKFGNKSRTGVFAAPEVSDYSKCEIIRHEKTFDEKVKGRIALREKTRYTFGPVFVLTKSPINSILDEVKENYEPEYEFESDFANFSELHGIKNRIFRVKEDSKEGLRLKELIKLNPLYIADGHHRYHASLLNKQTHFLAYICEKAEIQAYNRVINGKVKFADIKGKLDVKKIDEFKTPDKHKFAIFSKGGTFLLEAKNVPDDVLQYSGKRILPTAWTYSRYDNRPQTF